MRRFCSAFNFQPIDTKCLKRGGMTNSFSHIRTLIKWLSLSPDDTKPEGTLTYFPRGKKLYRDVRQAPTRKKKNGATVQLGPRPQHQRQRRMLFIGNPIYLFILLQQTYYLLIWNTNWHKKTERKTC